MKPIILFLSVLISVKAQSQNADLLGKYEYFDMDSITNIFNSGKSEILDIYAFDTTQFYAFNLIINNSSSQKRDVKIYNSLIRNANRSHNKRFYFFFEKMNEYHPDISGVNEHKRNLLEIHQSDLATYLKTLKILNPRFANDYSKNKVQIVKYKYHDQKWVLMHSL